MRRIDTDNGVLARQAADTVLNNWESVQPIIGGLVGSTLVDELTDTVVVHDLGKDVEWRVSKGFFSDNRSLRLRLATRMPTDKEHPENDIEYILGSSSLIINDNVGHIAASVDYGHVTNNDDAITAVLPDNPLGFLKLFTEIHDSSVKVVEEEERLRKHQRTQRYRKIGSVFGKTVKLVVVGGALAYGLPKAAEEVTDYLDNYDERQQVNGAEKRESERLAGEVLQQSVDAFDSQNETITDGVTLIDGNRQLVPATKQFVMVDEIPQYDFEGEHSQITNVRGFEAPKVGESKTYKIPIPEGSEVLIAHTGDSDLLVTAIIDESSQEIIISSIDLSADDDTEVKQNIGQLIITLAS